MPLFWLSTGFLAGLIAASAAGLAGGWGWWAAAFFLFLAALFEHRLYGRFQKLASPRRFLRLPVALLAAALFAGVACAPRPPVWTEADLAWYTGQGVVRLSGEVIEAPEPGQRSQSVVVEVNSLAVEQADGGFGAPLPVSGRTMARLFPGTLVEYGDKLTLTGSLKAPQVIDGFDYPAYLARQGIYTLIDYPRTATVAQGGGSPLLRAVYNLRLAGYRAVNAELPQPEASLLNGVVLGLDRDLPDHLADDFRETGTAHVIAISGANLAVLVSLFISLFRRMLPLPWAALATAAAVTFYTVLVGGEPAVVRAAVMACMGLLGRLVGRRQAGLNSLAFTAAVMCVFNPALPGDASFQLSFSATLGLILFAGPLQERFTRLLEQRVPSRLAKRIAGPVGEYLLVTLAAQVTTLPVVALQFGRVSLSALFANPLILPAQPLLMILGMLAVLTGVIWLPLGQALAALTWPLLAYTLRVVQGMAALPGGVISTASANWVYGLVYYLAVLPLGFERVRARVFSRRALPAAALAGAALLAAVVWRGVLAAPDGRAQLIVWGGVESAWLLRSPGGATLQVNAPADGVNVREWLGRSLPVFNRRLDALLVTSHNAAVYSSLETALVDIPAGQVWLPDPMPDKSAAERLASTLTERHTAIAVLWRGETLQIEAGVTIETLAVSEDCTAFWLEAPGFSMLSPGGCALDYFSAALAGRAPVVLLLNPDDLEVTLPAEWEKIGAQVTIVSGTRNPPLPGWLAVPESSALLLSAGSGDMRLSLSTGGP